MPSTLGERIRAARKGANLSQSQLASRIGAHFTSVSDWERNKNAPSARHLLSIAQVTGTEVAHFTGESGESEEDEESDQVPRSHHEMLAALAVALEPYHPKHTVRETQPA